MPLGTSSAALESPPNRRRNRRCATWQWTTDTDLWAYRDYDAWEGTKLTGYAVEAIDGEIGSVDEATYEASGSYVVVGTGPWIFGKKVMLQAGVIDRIDTTERRVYVNRTKDQI